SSARYCCNSRWWNEAVPQVLRKATVLCSPSSGSEACPKLDSSETKLPPSPHGYPRMTTLFSPINLRGLNLANRIMVSPMCQYSAVEGAATDWHFTHINSLALSGAAMFCIEATHVEAIGRITPGCLGLYDDATEAALKPILAAARKFSKAAVAMQLAHAGRKGSSHRPWEGGQLIPLS